MVLQSREVANNIIGSPAAEYIGMLGSYSPSSHSHCLSGHRVREVRRGCAEHGTLPATFVRVNE